ncbi:MAG TPA: ABC transporter permease, partial [Gemmataceae bacterium]|nr:ABC transporter permease [Gemmataceae bacterium]
MRKVLVIAAREYRAAVRSKGFLVTLVLMPVLMGTSAGVQYLFHRLEDTTEKKIALVDRSPDGAIAKALAADVVVYNTHLIADPRTGERTHPRIALEVVPPSAPDPESVRRQRIELSRQVAAGEVEAVIEVGPDVFAVRPNPAPELAADGQVIRWQAKNPGETFISRYLERKANDAVHRNRFAQAGYDPDRVRALQQPVPLRVTGLTREDPRTSRVEDAPLEQRLANFFLPAVLIALMFMVILVGATPAMQGIVEEKSQRIAEVLLGSVTPFQLMAGKLFGVVAVSLTMAAVYLGGAYVLASRFGMTELLTP